MFDIPKDSFEKIMLQILRGLKQKVARSGNGEDYPYSSVFQHGLNSLYCFALINKCFGKNGEVLAPAHETEAILQYFSRPAAEWIKNWPENVLEQIQEVGNILEWDSLLYVGQGNTFILTEFCEELLDAYENIGPIIEVELEQRAFYNQLRSLEQDDYVAVRRFIIEQENRVIESGLLTSKINQLVLDCSNCEDLRSILRFAYEPCKFVSGPLYICKRCGWTVTKLNNKHKKCQSEKCRSFTDNFSGLTEELHPASYSRLKYSVMRFIAEHGTIELEIERQCKNLGVKVEMWPELDRYDLRITFNNGEQWCVDAKDYSKAFVLKAKLKSQGNAIPPGEWSRGFIVVPNERINDDKEYCDIVKKGIRQEKVDCVKLKDFISIIKSNL